MEAELEYGYAYTTLDIENNNDNLIVLYRLMLSANFDVPDNVETYMLETLNDVDDLVSMRLKKELRKSQNKVEFVFLSQSKESITHLKDKELNRLIQMRCGFYNINLNNIEGS
ncbi:hypothetical protein PaeCFBP13512_18790 [Paenibacillus sp. CFBP13512]|uniref:hypothetical protein n=1 Tax=Paenibacillus sp. CFBP13512 TaxID=2184007 RepID=UPI0010C006F2|nr:hypothetical protein [Paenibacillus sp. CFBP13512]TKJ87270.1 hypothetical protein PaeCFBP13512_18790 [Paenibacillus sp. CFBP13512]